MPEEIIVIGAHYDSVRNCPAANDNGSGVAALLEIARLMAASPLARTVRLVFFVNEEPPFFLTNRMGSRMYARAARQRGDRIIGMLSLETMGYYTDRPASQKYPFPLGYFYPDQGNFIGFVGNLRSRRLVRRAVKAFQEYSSFPAQGAAVPGWLPGVGWSDHWSFWQEGYPAIMITDTAFYRYPYYHSPADTPDRLNYQGLARVVVGLTGVISNLAGQGV